MHTNVGLLQSPSFQLQCHADLFKVHLQALKEYKVSAYNFGDPAHKDSARADTHAHILGALNARIGLRQNART